MIGVNAHDRKLRDAVLVLDKAWRKNKKEATKHTKAILDPHLTEILRSLWDKYTRDSEENPEAIPPNFADGENSKPNGKIVELIKDAVSDALYAVANDEGERIAVRHAFTTVHSAEE